MSIGQTSALLQLAGSAPESEKAVLRKIPALVLSSIERQGELIAAFIVDDAGFSKRTRIQSGSHDKIVQDPQATYLPDQGKGRDCRAANVPTAYQLYLADDRAG